MKSTEFWRWTIPHPHRPGKTLQTRHRMTVADARRQYPTATKVPGSLELRELPENDDESYRNSTAAAAKGLPGYKAP